MTSLAPALAEPYGPPSDSFVVEPGTRSAYSYDRTYALACLRLDELRRQDPERFAPARIVQADQHVACLEASDLEAPIVEITGSKYNEMLSVLPPLGWQHADGVERFALSEFTSGRITQMYARLGDRYFTAPVRYGDRTTYLTAAVIQAALPTMSFMEDDS